MVPNVKNAGPVKLIVPRRFADPRGVFVETYNERDFAAVGIKDRFVQDNWVSSPRPHTVRGLHFQVPPHAQAKLVSCTRGAIFDVAVDLRRGSPSFGHWIAARLDPASCAQLYVPAGFAHGYCTIEPNSEVTYKVSALYAPETERGILWNDPGLGIAWPTRQAQALLSAKDVQLPGLAEYDSPFTYDGQPLSVPNGTVLAPDPSKG
jgi:dTDP-4-dehydrorhamnose 3,5-epimerase